jgi:hypothetical protein
VVGGGRPGSAALFYASGYALGRFWIEAVRGDDVRPVWGRLSEAQWTSLLVAVGAASVSRSLGAVAVAAVVLASAIGWGRRTPGVGDPRHAREMADALAVARHAASVGGPGLGQTSRGLAVSALLFEGEWTYAVSWADGGDAVEAARLAAQLAQCPPGHAVVPGSSGVVHVTRVVP